jgi:hypothetical protein
VAAPIVSVNQIGPPQSLQDAAHSDGPALPVAEQGTPCQQYLLAAALVQSPQQHQQLALASAHFTACIQVKNPHQRLLIIIRAFRCFANT